MRISTKTFSLMAVGLFAVGLAVGTASGCGGSSSTDYVGICKRSCTKYVSCMPSAGITTADCTTICANSANKTSCPNADQVAAAANNCLAMNDCTAYLSCSASAPSCGDSGGTGTGGSTGTTGTGGSSSGTGTGGSSSATGTGGHAAGTGGSTGAAGSGGTADCSMCDKANTCCMAEATMFGQPTSSCTFSNSTCTASGSNSASYAMSCQQILSAGQALSIAACQ